MGTETNQKEKYTLGSLHGIVIKHGLIEGNKEEGVEVGEGSLD